MEHLLRFRHNVMDISTINAFENIKGGINHDCKDVYFVRAVGTDAHYLKDIESMDKSLMSRMADGMVFYKRFNSLPKLFSVDDTAFYTDCYNKWIDSGKTEASTKLTNNKRLKNMLGSACMEIEKIYGMGNMQLSGSILKNLVVKLMYWFDEGFQNEDISWDERTSVKIAASNVQKKQEYMFFYMLTLMGCDVLLLQSRCDIGKEEDSLKLSAKFVLGDFSDVVIPEYDIRRMELIKAEKEKGRLQSNNVSSKFSKGDGSTRIKVQIPKKESKHKNSSVQQSDGAAPNSIINSDNVEKSFEELARLASSVVLIGIRDRTGKIIGSGSGIMIGEKGYILTNNHVASGGVCYSVRIEDDDYEYNTDEVIKYNPVLDLAVIRIQRRLNPIKVYNGSRELVRGQKVVAIGSPLGLFNSVSDGIISGFRRIDNVDMIQFTAPISHGSSGGAVLNMQGEVIGISTAGIDSGQNINLAVGYECINTFIRGFI